MLTLDQVTYTVKQARRLASFTQAQMASKLGISLSTYIKLENDPESVNLRQARILAKETGQPFASIFFE